MNITASDRSALIRLAASMPKGSAGRRAILASLQTAAVEGQPDPKKKYDLEVAYGQGYNQDLKKGISVSDATKAMKVLDRVYAAAESIDNGGYDPDPKIKKLQDRLDKSVYGVQLNLGSELNLSLVDPDNEDLSWHWTGDGWELD